MKARRLDRAAGQHPKFLELGAAGEALEALAARLNHLRQYAAPSPTLAPKLRRGILGPSAAEMLRDAAAVLERVRIGRVPLAEPIDDLTRLASEHAFVVAFAIDERNLPVVTFRPTRDDAESSECAGLLSDLVTLFNN